MFSKKFNTFDVLTFIQMRTVLTDKIKFLTKYLTC